ncbi:unnamed protein product [Prunus armeniaca]
MEEIRARRLSIQTSEGEIKVCKDLEDVPIEELPDGLMYLFNFRYLSLSRTSIKKLPESTIGQLCNLITLDISDTEIDTLL